MRVVYYVPTSFFEEAIPFIAEISRLVELHVVIEIHPGAWYSSAFDISPRELSRGVVSARSVMEAFPRPVQACIEAAASANLAVYGERGIHPSNWFTSRVVQRFVDGIRADVVHMEGFSGRLLWSLPFLRRAPLILTVHDPEVHHGENTLRKQIVRRLTIACARRIILHNRTQKAQFCQSHGVPTGTVAVVPLGVNCLYWNWIDESIAIDERTLLFFGRLSAYKGLETLFQAAPLACQRLPNLRIIVAGNPVPGYRLPPAPMLPNGGKLQILTGYVPNRQLAELFQRAAVVVCPYTAATQSAVVLTAYAFGKPVIGTAVGGLPEYITHGETGILIPPGSPEALAAAMVDLVERLVNFPDTLLGFQKQIEARCETDLSWSHIARRTFEVYQNTGAGDSNRHGLASNRR